MIYTIHTTLLDFLSFCGWRKRAPCTVHDGLLEHFHVIILFKLVSFSRPKEDPALLLFDTVELFEKKQKTCIMKHCVHCIFNVTSRPPTWSSGSSRIKNDPVPLSIVLCSPTPSPPLPSAQLQLRNPVQCRPLEIKHTLNRLSEEPCFIVIYLEIFPMTYNVWGSYYIYTEKVTCFPKVDVRYNSFILTCYRYSSAAPT